MIQCLKNFIPFCKPSRSNFYLSFKYETYSTKSQHTPYLSPHLNYKHFISNAKDISQNIINRNIKNANIFKVCSLYENFRNITTELNALRSEHNELSKSANKTSFLSTEESRVNFIESAKKLKQRIQQEESKLIEIENDLLKEALKIPNDTHPNTPIGKEENAKLIKRIGESIAPEGVTSLKDHLTLCKQLNLINLDQASNVTGSSWYYLMNEGALLELALIQYGIEKAIQKGFKPIITPDVIKSEFSDACGFQPRDSENLSQNYFISNESSQNLILSATAEIPLAGLYSNKILSHKELPIKLVGFGRAFRAEAGARGIDTKGLYRVHQFSKVELFTFTRHDQSDEMFEEIIKLQEEIYKDLGLCFRVMDMPTCELGASAYRKYDMEVWMPGRGRWGEISSASNCTDYQSRRLNIRYKSNTTEFVHTLNGTAIAVPRLIIALLENYQKDDGSVVIPKVLRKWMGNMDVIK
ncbi:17773_t:CDS:1 [Funneliformis geosporum]|uniref:serine--tRNA ligase n=1 Tax=Funneliformis geosporum TaxID=1117311 RepID=A0A9W4SED2_9GLOM|nr:1778_t:CDS:1 [Funneliformis geosporum]CAI2167205.1 17773_t:CDS:1 [Funneliformis geosporum]